MPRSPKDNQEIRDARQEQILTAASRVFAEKGYAQTKISDIAAAAGFSHGLVYHYFASKEEVFAAIVDEMANKIREELDADEDQRALERLVAGFERARGRCQDPVDASRMLCQAIMQGGVPDAVHDRLQSHVRAVYERVRERICEAQDEGDLDASLDSDELAAALLCLSRGMTIRLPGDKELPFGTPGPTTLLRMLGARADLIRGVASLHRRPRNASFPSAGATASQKAVPIEKASASRSSQKETS